MSAECASRLVLTPGDPHGIGPWVSAVGLCRLLHARTDVRVSVHYPKALFHACLPPAVAATFGEVQGRVEFVWDGPPVAPTLLDDPPGSTSSGRVQQHMLRSALSDVVRKGGALVTGPVSKAAIARVDAAFRGHTEFLAAGAARLCQLQAVPDVTMLFLGGRLQVALVTTHLALADVPARLSSQGVFRAGLHVAEALERLAASRLPIAVTGLNPHAGEGGLLGDEEARLIVPAITQLNAGGPTFSFAGPLPAEAAFRNAADGRYAGVVAMYHDQATIPLKLVDWGRSVNVTWGLPFVRTSVDHGVGYEARRHGETSVDVVDCEGMSSALRLALQLAR